MLGVSLSKLGAPKTVKTRGASAVAKSGPTSERCQAGGGGAEAARVGSGRIPSRDRPIGRVRQTIRTTTPRKFRMVKGMGKQPMLSIFGVLISSVASRSAASLDFQS